MTLREEQAMGKTGIAPAKNRMFLARHIPAGTWRLLALSFASLATLLMAGPHATYRKHGIVLLNDLNVTPGKIRTTEKSDPAVCGGGSTKAYRKPGIQSVYAIYGAKKKKGVCCEIDHLISLELGGDNGVTNEWPQPYLPKPGAHEKDEVENWLHAQVCSGQMELAEAQKEISEDWYAAYLEMHKLPAGRSGAR